jgi:hypothetical protein
LPKLAETHQNGASFCVMKLSGQLECFCSDIEKLVARYQEEFDLDDATLIGGLQMYSCLMSLQALGYLLEDDDEEDDEEEDYSV